MFITFLQYFFFFFEYVQCVTSATIWIHRFHHVYKHICKWFNLHNAEWLNKWTSKSKEKEKRRKTYAQIRNKVIWKRCTAPVDGNMLKWCKNNDTHKKISHFIATLKCFYYFHFCISIGILYLWSVRATSH